MKIGLKALGIVGLILVGVVGALFIPKHLFGIEQSTHTTSIVEAVERTEEVSLLSVRIQGITETKQTGELFGVTLPGSNRATFVMHTFTAKLGIDGKEVSIKKISDAHYQISLPTFTFIGHDDISFSLAAEEKGVLSWVTPEIDHLETVTDVLNDESKQELIQQNETALKEQAEFFYTTIITAVDPEVLIEFKYPQATTTAR